MEREEIKQFESVKYWRQSLEANAKKGYISQNNWVSLLTKMKTYLDFVVSGPDSHLNPDALLREALENSDLARSRIMKWYNWIQGGTVEGYEPWMKEGKPHRIAQNTAVSYLGRIRGFYTHNKVLFGKWKCPARIPSKSKQADAKLDVFKFDEENGEIFVDTPLLQQFLANLSFRDQTIALSLYSTSQDAGDLFKLTLGWLRGQEKESRLFWEGNREKTSEPFKVFFSKESTEMVRRYVGQERKNAQEFEPIWVVGREYEYEYNGDTITVNGGLTSSILGYNFRVAANAMGVKEEGKTNPLRPKRFRHLFRTACSTAGIDVGVTQAFMGHKTPVSSTYLSRGKAFLLSQFVQVEPFLTVFKSQDQGEIQDIKADLIAARRERDRLVKKLEVVEKELQSKLSLSEDDIMAIYYDSIGFAGGKSRKDFPQGLDDFDESELNQLFVKALRNKMLRIT